MSRKPEDDGTAASSRLIRIKALDLLARREHAVLEMRRKLCYKGFDEEQVDDVLAELASEDLISDERFTASYLSSHVARGEGPLRIRAALKQKGVRDELIEDALEAHAADWQALISVALQKRFAGHDPQNHKERARQARFLQQRGFTMDQIGAILFRSEVQD